jgi:flagellar hook-length control protein FliK
MTNATRNSPSRPGRSEIGPRTPPSDPARSADGAETSESKPFEDIIRSMRVRSGLRNSSARVRLEPPELGRILVEVRMVRDALRIDVRTETDAAREVVRGRAAQLRAALEQHGLFVEHFDVTSEGSPARHSDARPAPPTELRDKTRRAADWRRRLDIQG